ncbi:hypothetical protein GUJ93_ZPchr0013g36962 [Zizania palustris]|uniref:Uncharacterized protein n=1 Tax=Zizania palustris TaxID=103762 RepID=A0A8J5WWB4_ZIZPA|nr:hypothetical protein GUJ93_ZPchr0013g36962 [Zizania palustris]
MPPNKIPSFRSMSCSLHILLVETSELGDQGIDLCSAVLAKFRATMVQLLQLSTTPLPKHAHIIEFHYNIR